MPPVRRRADFTQLSEFERGRIVGLFEAGISYREIARRVGRNAATVLRCCRSWREEGQEGRRQGTGGLRRTTERQDRFLRQLAIRDRFTSTRGIANQWYQVEGRIVSMATVYRRIRSYGLCSYRPHLVLPLTPNHRHQRLQFCIARSNWNLEWNSIIFSDESRFCLAMHDGRQRVRRYRGERRDLHHTVERHVARTAGIMVWGAICVGSRSPLVFIQGGITARRYINDVLEPYALPYIQRVEDGIFQQDNARPHVARVTLQYLAEHNVNLLHWPPRSPDLSPIEHVWDMIGRRVSRLDHPPMTIAALRHEVQVAWDSIPQEDIDNLIYSMPRRVNECIRMRGRATHY